MGCGGSVVDDDDDGPSPAPQNSRPKVDEAELAQREAARKARQEEEERVTKGRKNRAFFCVFFFVSRLMRYFTEVMAEMPPPFELPSTVPDMGDEEAYKEYMRQKLEYQNWENSCLREAMKRIRERNEAE